jgi:hypothetical protein
MTSVLKKSARKALFVFLVAAYIVYKAVTKYQQLRTRTAIGTVAL